MIRVLIVDDSAMVRTVLRDFLTGNSEFVVIGEAVNGKEGVEKAIELSPDLITMDIDMPVMNGLDATEEITKRTHIPVVVITTQDSSKVAYDATIKGALEFYSKSLFTSRMSENEKKRILDTLRRISGVKAAGTGSPSQKTFVRAIPRQRNAEIVLIGSSTGGPKALLKVLPLFPRDFPQPIVLVQHNSSGFDKGFAEWLNEYCNLTVRVAVDGEHVSRGVIYVAPTDRHLEFAHTKILLTNGEPVHNQKPAVDVTFASAARAFGKDVVSAVLTGMGSDGADGTSAIKDEGGVTIAQDESTSLIYGMPKAAFETGKVDIVLPLEQIAEKIIELCTRF